MKKAGVGKTNSRTINIEEGMPTLEQAKGMLARELNYAKEDGVPVVKIIHGYGSSGTGGKLRKGLRAYLTALSQTRQIKYFLPGEEFTIFNKETITILGLCPEFSKDKDLNRSNNGVTFIVL